MNDVRFSEPVTLRLGSSGERKVATVWEALECMYQQWPIRARDHSWRVAFQACRDALDGWRTPQNAQKAFLKAARQAGLIPQQFKPALPQGR